MGKRLGSIADKVNVRIRVLILASKCAQRPNSDSFAPPVGLHLLGHHLKQNGIECDVVDPQLDPGPIWLRNVSEGKYAVIGVSVTHWNILSDLDLLWQLRTLAQKGGRRCLFVAGGNSATNNPLQWLKCGFDVIALGYDNGAMGTICERYGLDQNALPDALCRDVRGVAFLDVQGQMKLVPASPLTQAEFENLQFTQAMEIEVPYKKYWDHIRPRATRVLTMNKRSFIVENARLYTSSRCLANCGFCTCPSFLSTAQRSHSPLFMLSPTQVHELILHHVRSFGVRAFSFNDDDFLVGNRAGVLRAIGICELIVQSKQRGEIPDGVRFSCQTRVNDFFHGDSRVGRFVKHDLLDAMANAGFHNVSVGVETFSDRLITSASINKKNVTSADCHALIQTMMKRGLYPTINLIFGIPESTPQELLETIRQTMQYVEKPCQISVATTMMAFPGAPIWNSKEYPTKDAVWKHPITNEGMCFPEYYIPKDEKVAALIDRLGEASGEEVEKLRATNGWDEALLVPRIAIALCTFMAIARIWNQRDLLEEVRDKIHALVVDIASVK
jgi:radical SAM superfamily enzyme YgiQ (UPF0313 family)